MKNILRPFFLLFPLIILGFFLIKDILPSGILETTLTPNQKSAFINSPLPQERITKEKEFFSLIADPVYFTISPPPGHFDNLELEITFQAKNTPILEIGPQMNIFTQAFDLKPLWQETLTNSNWHFTNFGQTSIWHKSEKISDFNQVLDLERSPQTLIYHHEVTTPFIIPNYQPNTQLKQISLDARGSHKLQTYLKNEDLNIDFVFTDMNRVIGPDEINIKIFNSDNQQVFSKRVPDDGNERNDQQVTRHDISISIPNLPEGVYEIDIQTTSDIFLREIETTLSKLVFQNKLHLADPIGWRNSSPRTVFITDGNEFSMQTLHVEGVQTILLDNQKLEMKEPHKKEQFLFESASWRRLEIPKANIEISTNGVIAFDPSFAFNPNPRRLTPWTNIEKSQTETIISTYKTPEKIGNWYKAQAFFSAPTLPKIDNDSWRFVISAPGISDFDGEVKIKSIKATFRRSPLLTPKDWLNSLKERLPF